MGKSVRTDSISMPVPEPGWSAVSSRSYGLDHGDSHHLRRYEHVLQLCADENNPTPLVRLRHTPFKKAKVYAKLEWYNPFGSIKDRIAYNLVKAGKESGNLKSNMAEATSGNTGLAMAMVANQQDVKMTVPISLKVPVEKRNSLRAVGADVLELPISEPKPGKLEDAMEKAKDLSQQPDWWHPDQYKNLNNPAAHYLTTGPEIWKQTEGKVTHFVAVTGTCGTITGTSRYLKSQNKDVKTVAVMPVVGHDISGVRSRKQLAYTKHFHEEEYDEVVLCDNKEAYDATALINKKESLRGGPTSGLGLAGAVKGVPDEEGNVVVLIFCDTVCKYMDKMQKHVPELFPQPEEVKKPVEITKPEIRLDEDNELEIELETTSQGTDSTADPVDDLLALEHLQKSWRAFQKVGAQLKKDMNSIKRDQMNHACLPDLLSEDSGFQQFLDLLVSNDK